LKSLIRFQYISFLFNKLLLILQKEKKFNLAVNIRARSVLTDFLSTRNSEKNSNNSNFPRARNFKAAVAYNATSIDKNNHSKSDEWDSGRNGMRNGLPPIHRSLSRRQEKITSYKGEAD